MEKYFNKDRFATHLGMELVEARPGYALLRMAVGEQHLNGFGTVHGGAIFTLADTAFAQAANAGDQIGVALEVDISYVRPGQEGILTAEAVEITRNRRIGIYQVRVTDAQDKLIALFKGTAYFKG